MVLSLALWSVPIALAIPLKPDITVTADVSDTAHKLIRVKEVLAVTPGPITLLFPQWIQGHHAPTGTSRK